MFGSLWPVFLLAVLASSLVQSTLSFGFAIIAMIVFPTLFPAYAQATATSALLTTCVSTLAAIRSHAHTRWRILLPCVAGYFLVVPFSIRLSASLDKAFLMRLLGGFLILLSLYFIFGGNRLRIRPTVASGVIAGMISGLLSGLFALGGPPVVIYLLSSLQDKDEYIGTSQTTFAISGLYATLMRLINGVFTAEMVVPIAAGLAVVAIGFALGRQILKRISLELMRKLIYVLMIVSGAKMVLGL